MTHTEQKKQPMEIDLEVTLILELADKDFKADFATVQGYQENKLVMNEQNEISVEALETLTKN